MSRPLSNPPPTPFNPYHIWLGIPPDECPPNHYRLLGISLFESNADVILNAADQRMAHLRTFQNGPRAKFCQQLLNRVADAQSCLLNHVERERYNTDLRKTMRRAEPPLRPISAAPGTIPIGIMPEEIEAEPVRLENDFADPPDTEWYMTTPEGQQFGSVEKEILDRWEREGRLSAGCFIRAVTSIKWSPAGEYYPWLDNQREAAPPLFSSIERTHRPFEQTYDGTNNERVLAGILGIFLGCLVRLF